MLTRMVSICRPRDPPASASQSAGTTGLSHRTRPLLCSFTPLQWFNYFLTTSLCYGTVRCSRFMLYISNPSPRINHFSVHTNCIYTYICKYFCIQPSISILNLIWVHTNFPALTHYHVNHSTGSSPCLSANFCCDSKKSDFHDLWSILLIFQFHIHV